MSARRSSCRHPFGVCSWSPESLKLTELLCDLPVHPMVEHVTLTGAFGEVMCSPHATLRLWIGVTPLILGALLQSMYHVKVLQKS